MCRASPVTTVSVTARSGWSELPDFSAYLRAYAHILSMFAAEGSCIPSPGLRGTQRRVDRLRVEAGEALVADDDDRQRQETERHQLLARLRILADVSLGELDTLLRQILHRFVTGPSTA